MFKRWLVGILFGIVFAVSPLLAITAGDLVNKMPPNEQFDYIGGAIDATMYLVASREKDPKRAQCIDDWFYGKENRAAAAKEVVTALRAYQDQIAVGVVEVVIERHCGK